MPYYDYKCKLCGFEEIDRIAHMNDDILPCPACQGGMMARKLHSRFGINMGAAGVNGYYDDNLGCYINTNHQRREEMLKQGVCERGATPKEGCAWV